MLLLQFLVLWVACIFTHFSAAEKMVFRPNRKRFTVFFDQNGLTRVVFKVEGERAVVSFHSDGRVRRVAAGSETYVVRYNALGDVRKVVQKQASV